MKTLNRIVRKYRHGVAKFSFLPKVAKASCVALELQFAIHNRAHYVPYVYQAKGDYLIDTLTGLLAISHPKLKGDGSFARISY